MGNYQARLNQVIAKITSKDFLENKGLGNDIGFWIFDYPIEGDDDVTHFLNDTIIPTVQSAPHHLKILHVDLFKFLTDILEERNLLDKVIKLQLDNGDAKTLDAIKPVLKEDKLAQKLADLIDHNQTDIVLLSGVANAYPMLRTHTLLSALHPYMQNTPLLMFYPGSYDGHTLKLFNTLSDDHYYRAFRLVP